MDRHLLVVGKIFAAVAHDIFVLHRVRLLEVRKAFLVILHEGLENFADPFDLCGHSLAHPDSSFHIFLLVVSLPRRDVL